VEKVVVDGPGAGFGYQSAGVRVGELLWIASQFADQGRRSGAAHEIDNILSSIARTCQNAGTNLSNLLRLRALVAHPSDALAVYSALKNAIPHDPPVVCVLAVGAPMHVSGCSVALDAVAYVGVQ
jgi:enamine deaminase RidA (YjgF/YER057c/UK114 family)